MRKVSKERNKICIVIYVYDMFLLVDSYMINNKTTCVKNYFELTVKDELDEYVGSQIEFRNYYIFIYEIIII